MNADLEIHGWNQAYYGLGLALGTTLDIPLSQRFSAIANAQWKMDGYLIGSPIPQGLSGHIGLKYMP
ncbi:MAG TPA: hypothetical protein VJ861_12270 [Treponemataceae bacterium]|nr:hypothetical protein [Treponemataceae bacterium]